MTNDDEFFFDYLASIPNDVRRYSAQVADSIDRHVDHAASVIRDSLSHQSWIPASIRPADRKAFQLAPLPPQSVFSRAHDWVLRNRAWTAAIVAFVGTGGILMYGSQKLNTKKRRARRAGNGARKEIIVIAGSPHEAMTRAVASDLERRGFIVFVTVTSPEEEHVVKSEEREDIRPLWLDPTANPDSSEIHPALHEIQSLITQPQSPMPGVQPHVCQLSGLILIPSPNYPTGPVATIPASTWSDTINTRLLYPILTTQLLLPLLTLKSNNSSILLLTPSIQSSLSAPFASPEVTSTRALSSFVTTLRRELRFLESSHGGGSNIIDVVELKLGNIDLGRQYRNNHNQGTGTEVLAWPPQQRALYGPTYLSSLDHRLAAANGGPYGSSAKELHFAVFDALVPSPKSMFGRRERKKHTIYVGRGARAYSVVGNIFPGVLLGWMFGLRSGHSASPLREIGWDPDGSASASSSETGWEKVA